MKKLGLIGLVALGLTGCGHGWMPFRPFRGAVCRDNCVEHAHTDGCSGCAGYSSYEGEVGMPEPYYGPGSATPPMNNQPMSNLQPGR